MRTRARCEQKAYKRMPVSSDGFAQITTRSLAIAKIKRETPAAKIAQGADTDRRLKSD